MGINKKLGIHCGKLSGSVCNTLTRQKIKDSGKLDCIKFEESDEKILGVNFDTFFESINNNSKLIEDW